MHRLPVHPQRPGNGRLVHPGLGQVVDGVEALLHLPLGALPGRFAVQTQVRQRGPVVPCSVPAG